MLCTVCKKTACASKLARWTLNPVCLSLDGAVPTEANVKRNNI